MYTNTPTPPVCFHIGINMQGWEEETCARNIQAANPCILKSWSLICSQDLFVFIVTQKLCNCVSDLVYNTVEKDMEEHRH